jgi:hypothetical protein
VIISSGQVTELPAEGVVAGVVSPGLAVAVSAPVSERFHDPSKWPAVRENRAALASGDVVRRIEAQSGQVGEGADALSGDGRIERVAAILHQP